MQIAPPQVRLSELLGALSLVTDLARGHPYEHALRSCLVATRLAEALNLDENGRVEAYYTTLLRSVGCTATSHEYASVFGDDVGVRRRGDLVDATRPSEALGLLLASDPRRGRLLDRARRLALAFRDARPAVSEGSRADCEVGSAMARRFGLPAPVSLSMLDIWERWDGNGAPEGKRGVAIALAARIAMVATVAVIFEDAFGSEGAERTLGEWSGRALDPAIVDAFRQDPSIVRDAVDASDPLELVIAAEPGRARHVNPGEFDDVALGFSQVVDLKSPFFHGHSESVADLAAKAGRLAGLDEGAQVSLRRAGLLHDLGRAGVSTAIWEKPGRLSKADWEAVRLHSYHSERILSAGAPLASLARLAGMHHERLDGSGYHRGAPASMLDMQARILAAADAYQALRSPRPYRPSRNSQEAISALAEMPLDREAVAAVLAAAGERASLRRAALPGGLTEREVEVLRLLVGGMSERVIAERLVVSQSTIHTHVVHVYEKAGVSTRAAAAVFAMQHDLVRPNSAPKID